MDCDGIGSAECDAGVILIPILMAIVMMTVFWRKMIVMMKIQEPLLPKTVIVMGFD